MVLPLMGLFSSAIGGEQCSQRGSNPNSIPTTPVPPPEGTAKLMVALYDYDPQELSPNVDAEVRIYLIFPTTDSIKNNFMDEFVNLFDSHQLQDIFRSVLFYTISRKQPISC